MNSIPTAHLIRHVLAALIRVATTKAVAMALYPAELLTLRMQTVNFVIFSVASLEHGVLSPAALVVEYEMAPVPLPPAATLFTPVMAAFFVACHRRAAG